MAKVDKSAFYSLTNIKKRKADYNIIFGERSNGKTYSVLKEILTNYLKKGEKGAIIRRYDLDFKSKRGSVMFNGLIGNGILDGTDWDGIRYYAGAWTLYRNDEKLNKKVYDKQPFCYSFSLASFEHDKSTSYDDVTIVLFDEFLTRGSYLNDEFIIFMNVLSTIIRHRDNVVIYMLGNTVSFNCPYFKEMGLKHITNIDKGKIEVYQYGNSKLKVAVEYSDFNAQSKPSDKYFAFDNPRLQMITGGAWELAIYPHLPIKYRPNEIKFKYFVMWEDDILQCEIINKNHNYFTYIHRKTTPIKDEDRDLIFSPEPSYKRNYRRFITKPIDKLGKTIIGFFNDDKVFYQDNEVGEIMRYYLQYSMNYSIIRS